MALKSNNCNIDFLYYKPEPYWPKGRLSPWMAGNESSDSHKSKYQIRYFNFPIVRGFSLSKCLIFQLEKLKNINENDRPIIISYNAPSWLQSAIRKLKAKSKLQWICIVADGVAPMDADGYVFLSYGYYRRFPNKNKMHLDGGIYPITATIKSEILNKTQEKKIFVFSGGFGRWAGAELILDALQLLDRSDFQVIMTGPTPSDRIIKIINRDQRVQYLGLLDESELMEVYALADYFINPRPTRIKYGENNFPSKLLDYMGWKKPILSTWTEGLSPEYKNRLEIFEESPKELAKLIEKVIENPDLSKTTYHLGTDWETHGKRLCEFLQNLNI